MTPRIAGKSAPKIIFEKWRKSFDRRNIFAYNSDHGLGPNDLPDGD
jgi:hypothetical protein